MNKPSAMPVSAIQRERLSAISIAAFVFLCGAHLLLSQTKKGENLWWTCPDCGAKYLEDDYRRHRATAHADRYTPEARKQLLNIPASVVSAEVVETATDPSGIEMSVNFTPHPEETGKAIITEFASTKSSPTPPAPITSDIIKVPSAEAMKKGAKIETIKPEDIEREIAKEKRTDKTAPPEVSLSQVKMLLEHSKLTVVKISPTELSVMKSDDAKSAVRVEYRRNRSQVVFKKFFSVKKDAEETEVLRLANQFNFLNEADVHCYVSDFGDSGKRLVMYSTVNLAGGLSDEDLSGAFADLQKAMAVANGIDKQEIFIPVKE